MFDRYYSVLYSVLYPSVSFIYVSPITQQYMYSAFGAESELYLEYTSCALVSHLLLHRLQQLSYLLIYSSTYVIDIFGSSCVDLCSNQTTFV